MATRRHSLRQTIESLPSPEVFWAGFVLMAAVVALVLLGLVWMPYEPTAMSADRLQGISAAHLLGTDKMGRDILSRVMYGSRVTLAVALGTMAIGAGTGILVGAVTGFYGGIVDEVVMRVMDGLFAFPSVLYVRIKHLDYVKNARLQGASDARVIFVHMLPNVRGVLLSNIMIGFNNAVLAEAGLSFLGIGSQPPYASLGQMISEAQEIFFRVPTSVLGPGIVIVAMVLGFSLMGEGIRPATQSLD